MEQPHPLPFRSTEGAPAKWRLPTITVNRIRLISGLWLLLYAATHLVNMRWA